MSRFEGGISSRSTSRLTHSHTHRRETPGKCVFPEESGPHFSHCNSTRLHTRYPVSIACVSYQRPVKACVECSSRKEGGGGQVLVPVQRMASPRILS